MRPQKAEIYQNYVNSNQDSQYMESTQLMGQNGKYSDYMYVEDPLEDTVPVTTEEYDYQVENGQPDMADTVYYASDNEDSLEEVTSPYFIPSLTNEILDS